MIDFMPYFAAIITVLFGIGFSYAITYGGEKYKK
jgi:hypothetical protein